MSYIPLLLNQYLTLPPPPMVGFKRDWIRSVGRRPGRWTYHSYTFDDALDWGLFEFDSMGSRWDFRYEEWVPMNPFLRDDVFMYGMEDQFAVVIATRDDDFIDYLYRLLQSFSVEIK